MKVIFCIPTITKPYQVMLDSLEASVPLLEKAGWEHGMVNEIGCPYISAARSMMLRKALDAKADVIVFIDHDLSWEPSALLKLIETDGDVVSGNYRFKSDDEVEYMGALLPDPDGNPQVRDDGCVKAFSIPAGFLKITKRCVNIFMRQNPELLYGDRFAPHVDLFNHGAHEFVWYGEDYAFSRRWIAGGNEIVVIPDINLDHWRDDKCYKGNFHEYLMTLPGGAKEAA